MVVSESALASAWCSQYETFHLPNFFKISCGRVRQSILLLFHKLVPSSTLALFSASSCSTRASDRKTSAVSRWNHSVTHCVITLSEPFGLFKCTAPGKDYCNKARIYNIDPLIFAAKRDRPSPTTKQTLNVVGYRKRFRNDVRLVFIHLRSNWNIIRQNITVDT